MNLTEHIAETIRHYLQGGDVSEFWHGAPDSLIHNKSNPGDGPAWDFINATYEIVADDTP